MGPDLFNFFFSTHMRDYMDRRVTLPIWGLLPPCKQAAKFVCIRTMINVS